MRFVLLAAFAAVEIALFLLKRSELGGFGLKEAVSHFGSAFGERAWLDRCDVLKRSSDDKGSQDEACERVHFLLRGW